MGAHSTLNLNTFFNNYIHKIPNYGSPLLKIFPQLSKSILQSVEDKVVREFLYVYDSKYKVITLKSGIEYCFTNFSKIINNLCQQY